MSEIKNRYEFMLLFDMHDVLVKFPRLPQTCA